MKMLVIRLLFEANRADVGDKVAEGSGQALT
jgi:hypothetical protein